MRNLKTIYTLILNSIISVIIITLIAKPLFANNISLIIEGNQYTDENAILSIIEKKPTDISETYSNYLLKTLDKSNLFENVTVTINENSYIIKIS